jgi:hypothetical protein
MKYNLAIENNRPTCLPPEAYIRLWAKASTGREPKFQSSVYPPKKKKEPKK